MVVIELPAEDDIDIFINSYHSIENYENIDETLLEVRIICITMNSTLPL